MAGKGTGKTRSAAKKKVTHKTAAKKKAMVKKAQLKNDHSKKAKATPFKSKLGHDPLAWITGEDAADLGISFDDIEKRTETTLDQLEKVVPDMPPIVEAEHQDNTSADENVSTIKTGELTGDDEINHADNVAVVVTDTSIEDLAAQGWGLFDDEPDAPDKSAEPVVESDGSWGLFDDEPVFPVGEGVAWGLFADEDGRADVEHDAVVITLPEAFNVASVSKLYHEIDLKIHDNHDMILDAKDVETIDAAGLQLLFAVQKELQQHDCRLVLKDGNEKLEVLSKSSFIDGIVGING